MSTISQPTLFTRLGFDPAYLSAFEDKLFIEGPQTARRLTNFFALLLFATVIATYGVLSNSTATVIGAMIVAPLMGPMMATTSAVVMGSLPRAMRAFALTVAGIVSVIIFSYLLTFVVPDVTISFTSNGEIASRINPGLYALLTALGAGAAGAFITSRAEIADSIGGDSSRPGKVGGLAGTSADPPPRLSTFRCVHSARDHSTLADGISKHYSRQGKQYCYCGSSEVGAWYILSS